MADGAACAGREQSSQFDRVWLLRKGESAVEDFSAQPFEGCGQHGVGIGHALRRLINIG
jgi:hypothetical protein